MIDGSISKEDLRTRSEEMIRRQSHDADRDLEGIAPEEIQKTLHELQVHKIELEMQNDELHRSKSELDVMTKHYMDLYHTAPVGYCTLDAEGRIIEANLTLSMILGVIHERTIKRPFTDFIHPEDQDTYYLYRKKIERGSEHDMCELRLTTDSDEMTWVGLQTMQVDTIDASKLSRIVLIDLTERKRTQKTIETLNADLQRNLQELDKALTAQKSLTRELHHRVKNNMQLIISIYRMKFANIDDPLIRNKLHGSESHIIAMSKIHELSYIQGDIELIDMQAYYQGLVDDFQHIHAYKELTIDVDCHIGLSTEQALVCGIILNELLSNSVKDSFEKKGPTNIMIGMYHLTDRVHFSVKDNSSYHDDEIAKEDTDLILIEAMVFGKLQGSMSSSYGDEKSTQISWAAQSH